MQCSQSSVFLFYFEITLGLLKNCRNNSYCIPFTQHLLMLISYIVIVQLSEVRNQHLYSAINETTDLFEFHSFSINIFFCFSIQSRSLHCMSPYFFWLVTISWSFFVFHDLKNFQSTDQAFCRMSLNLDLSDVFSYLRLCIFEKYHK